MGAGCSSTAATAGAVAPTTATGPADGGATIGSSPTASTGRAQSPPSTDASRPEQQSRRRRRLFSRRPRGPPTASELERERRRERERAEIENLQRELAAMEALFQQLLGNALREMQEEAEAMGPPPASAEAIRRLPTIVVAAEDLMEEQNRQCAVCFGNCHVGHRMCRLPCGHLFHGSCIGPWLYKRCTCPVCRYELPTDSTDYEEGRIERMRERRPRLRRHELDRMKLCELKDLAYERLDLSTHRNALTDKADLIREIEQSGKVDIIESPDPVEYRLTDLRSMRVGALRKEMEEAGVYFSPEDVIEKEDMIQLFLHSGRVALLDCPESGRKKSIASSISDEEPVDESDDDEEDIDALRRLVKATAQ